MKLSKVIEFLQIELERFGDVEIEASKGVCELIDQPTKNFSVYVYDPEPQEARSDDNTLPYQLSFEPNKTV